MDGDKPIIKGSSLQAVSWKIQNKSSKDPIGFSHCNQIGFISLEWTILSVDERGNVKAPVKSEDLNSPWMIHLGHKKPQIDYWNRWIR